MKKELIILFMLISILNGTQIQIYEITSRTDTLDRFMNEISKSLYLYKRDKDTNILLIDLSMGDSDSGEKLYIKKLQKYCEMSSSNFASMHSQDEWEEIVDIGHFSREVIEICPKLKEIYKSSWSPNLYQFAYEYASDSGNIPSD